MSKHGVKNGVAMATSDTLDVRFLHNLVLLEISGCVEVEVEVAELDVPSTPKGFLM